MSENDDGGIDPANVFPSLETFVFDTPLYDEFILQNGDGSLFLFQGNRKIDGYCPKCETYRVFTRSAGSGSTNFGGLSQGSEVPNGSYRIVFYCAMNSEHIVDVFAKIAGNNLTKIGQYPSLADISNDEAKTYRRVLDVIDRKELSRAVGLAAHGIGVGSFVYLRRVFERLIESRYRRSGLKIERYPSMSMEEKIKVLKDHLPEFLVSNKSIYGILSKGIHELSEESCLSFYEVLHESILVILEDDRRKKEDEDRRAKLAKAISGFSGNNQTN